MFECHLTHLKRVKLSPLKNESLSTGAFFGALSCEKNPSVEPHPNSTVFSQAGDNHYTLIPRMSLEKEGTKARIEIQGKEEIP